MSCLGAFIVGLSAGAGLALLAGYFIGRVLLAENDRRVAQAELERDEAREAASSWMTIAEETVDELRELKGPRPRRNARWN